MSRMNSYIAFLTLAALPVIGQAAGYTFTSFQYPSGGGTILTSIDDSNRVAGYNNGSSTQGFLLTAAGSVANLNLPGFVYDIPFAINSTYGVVGVAFDGTNQFMFQNGPNGLGTISADLTNQTVTGINSSESTVGNFISSSGAPAVYAKIRGAYHTLLPKGTCSYTHDPAINDHNVVVASCVTPAGANIMFTWAKNKFTYLPTPSGIGYIQPTCINKSGVIAGFYDDASGFAHGFVLNGSSFTVVDYPGTGVVNTIIEGINSAGKLVGFYDGPAVTGFVATPR